MRAIVDKDAEKNSGRKFLEAAVRDAYYMADMTAAFLKSQGYRPSRKKADIQNMLPADSPTMLRARAVLLNLAAALRIASWERAGLRSELPADLPTSSEAFQRLLPPEIPDSPESKPVVPELGLQVFQTWLQRFSRSSRAALGTDIVLPIHTVTTDELLDALADVLFKNRHLADMKEKNSSES